jgi:hypothetical protein
MAPDKAGDLVSNDIEVAIASELIPTTRQQRSAIQRMSNRKAPLCAEANRIQQTVHVSPLV